MKIYWNQKRLARLPRCRRTERNPKVTDALFMHHNKRKTKHAHTCVCFQSTFASYVCLRAVFMWSVFTGPRCNEETLHKLPAESLLNLPRLMGSSVFYIIGRRFHVILFRMVALGYARTTDTPWERIRRASTLSTHNLLKKKRSDRTFRIDPSCYLRETMLWKV